MPERIHRRSVKGWRMPKSAMWVGRPSIFGNPFTHPDPAKAVEAYRRLISGGTKQFAMGPGGLQFARDAHPDTLHWAYGDFVREQVHILRGWDLVCWCPLDQPCHADVLLEIANG